MTFNPKKGDYVFNKYGDKFKVLLVIDDIFFTGVGANFDDTNGYYTFAEAERGGWKVVDEVNNEKSTDIIEELSKKFEKLCDVSNLPEWKRKVTLRFFNLFGGQLDERESATVQFMIDLFMAFPEIKHRNDTTLNLKGMK